MFEFQQTTIIVVYTLSNYINNGFIHNIKMILDCLFTMEIKLAALTVTNTSNKFVDRVIKTF